MSMGGQGSVAPSAMQICASCGAIAPTGANSCGLCSAGFGESRLIAPDLGYETFCVVVRSDFRCRVCGHLSPLDHLDVDGSVDCAGCGSSQVFDVSTWKHGLAFAHAVGDLAGPNPEGRLGNPNLSIADKNKHRHIGVGRASARSVPNPGSSKEAINRSLRVEVAPGHPLCTECRTPVAIAIDGARTQTQCPRCGETATYEMPEAAAGIYYGLRGVLASEHLSGVGDCTSDESPDGSALAIRCPNCYGALSADSSTLFHCGFCNAPLRVREQLRHKLSSNLDPAPWWLIFSGPSDKRLELERRDALVAGEPRGRIEKPPEARSKLGALFAGTLLPAAIVAIVGLVGFGDEIEAWRASAADAPRADEEGSDVSSEGASSEDAEAAEPVEELAVRISGCACPKKLGKLDIDATRVGGRIELGARLDGPDVVLASNPNTAPPSRTESNRLAFGLACRGDAAIVAWEDRVSAWSRKSGEELWTVALPSNYRAKRPSASDGVRVKCRRMRVRRSRVVVPTQGDGLRLRIENGLAE